VNDLKFIQSFSFLGPLLISLSYPIFLYGKSLFIINLQELIFPILFLATIIIFSWFILKTILHNGTKSAIILTVFVLLFFNYGIIYDSFDDFEFNGSYLRHQYLLVFFVVIFSVILFYILKTKHSLSKINFGIQIFSLFVISIGITFVITATLTDSYEKNEIKEENPNIYYFILNAYANPEIMKSVYQYNNDHFINFLKSKSFYVPENSFSNYRHGFLSLSSSLNIEYVNYFSDIIPTNSRNFHLIYQTVDQNRIMKYFKSNGYKIINFGSYDGLTGNIEVAEIHLCKNDPFLESQILMMVIRKSMMSPIYTEFFDEISNEREICVFETLKKIYKDPQPTFTFVYFHIPHSPYRFSSDGKFVSFPPANTKLSETEHIIGYTEQTKFLENSLKITLSEIIFNDPNSIIIIQSDVGTSLQSLDNNETMLRKMKIFNAYYLGGNETELLYDSITPVNSFRIILKEFFNENLELLDDKLYYSEYGQELNFTDVTLKLLR